MLLLFFFEAGLSLKFAGTWKDTRRRCLTLKCLNGFLSIEVHRASSPLVLLLMVGMHLILVRCGIADTNTGLVVHDLLVHCRMVIDLLLIGVR